MSDMLQPSLEFMWIENIPRRDAHHLDANLSKAIISNGICGGIMLLAIHFKGNLCNRSVEIQKVTQNRVLSTEFEAKLTALDE